MSRQKRPFRWCDVWLRCVGVSLHENQRMLGRRAVIVASHELSLASDPAPPTSAPPSTNLPAQQQAAYDDYGLSSCAG